jgi:hypothetical protein
VGGMPVLLYTAALTRVGMHHVGGQNLMLRNPRHPPCCRPACLNGKAHCRQRLAAAHRPALERPMRLRS